MQLRLILTYNDTIYFHNIITFLVNVLKILHINPLEVY